jgi:hypothetical protein
MASSNGSSNGNHSKTNGTANGTGVGSSGAVDDGIDDEAVEAEFSAGMLSEDERGELEPPPPAVADFYAACVRFCVQKYGVVLDGTQDTLSIVDQYVRDARAELAIRADAMDIVSGAVGAYLGEVCRRTFGARWFADGDPSGWRLDFTRVFLTFNPVGMAREALTGEIQPGWHAHLDMDPAYAEEVQARLGSLGDVEEDEYYLPTTRFDVITIAVAAIHSRMVEAGVADVTFSTDDYRKN